MAQKLPVIYKTEENIGKIEDWEVYGDPLSITVYYVHKYFFLSKLVSKKLLFPSRQIKLKLKEIKANMSYKIFTAPLDFDPYTYTYICTNNNNKGTIKIKKTASIEMQTKGTLIVLIKGNLLTQSTTTTKRQIRSSRDGKAILIYVCMYVLAKQLIGS